jgi:hypothetical protein
MDITDVVIETLNGRYPSPKAKVTPASNTTPAAPIPGGR